MEGKEVEQVRNGGQREDGEMGGEQQEVKDVQKEKEDLERVT